MCAKMLVTETIQYSDWVIYSILWNQQMIVMEAR